MAVLLLGIGAAGAAAQEAPRVVDPARGAIEEAYRRRMASDLRNLFTAQEIHYSSHNTYAGPSDDVNALAALRFRTSGDVRLRIVEASTRGWAAVASVPALPGEGCALYVGAAAAPRTPGGTQVAEPGWVQCDGFATVQTLRSDLRQLMSAQEVHYSTAMTYAPRLEDLDFEPSPHVTVRVTQADERGNAATATSGLTTCAYFVGSATPPVTPRGAAPTDEGRVACD